MRTGQNGSLLLATTTLDHSNDLYFRERLPWQLGMVQLDAGPSVMVHLHGEVGPAPCRVRVGVRLDRAGQAVLIGFPEKESETMNQDKMLREMGSDPRQRKVLVTDGKTAVGQAVARAMIPRKRGRIINICSVQSELGRPGIAPYAASKGALKMLTKGMAIDWGPHGLTVNGIGPGYFKTELNANLVANPEFSDWLVQRTPSRRWGDVAELAGAAVFLASDAASFVNGHILYVDGGITASL